MRNSPLILIARLLLTDCLSAKKIDAIEDRLGIKYEIDSGRRFAGILIENG